MEQNQVQGDITYIRDMIENNRRTLVDNGMTFISIGVYVVIGVVISYILGIKGIGGIPFTTLADFNGNTVCVQFHLQKKQEDKRIRKTFASEIFNAVWLACAVPIIAVSVLYFIVGNIPLQTLFITISAILGVGYYLTGQINELPFMKVLAFGWWLGTIAALLWSNIGDEAQLPLLFAGLIFLLEVIPGIVIYRKWKRVYNE